MLAAALIVAGIAVVDSLNPGTIAPALALSVSDKPARRILEFAVGFFVVNVAGGILLTFGLSFVPHPDDSVKHVGATVAGVALLIGAVALLVGRKRLTRPKPEITRERRVGGSATLFGGGIALAELPTAFPYFAAIAAIEAAHLSFVGNVLLIALFNVIFLAPVFGMALLIELVPSAWHSFVDPVRRWMSRHWPVVLAAVLAAGGAASLVYGLSS